METYNESIGSEGVAGAALIGFSKVFIASIMNY